MNRLRLPLVKRQAKSSLGFGNPLFYLAFFRSNDGLHTSIFSSSSGALAPNLGHILSKSEYGNSRLDPCCQVNKQSLLLDSAKEQCCNRLNDAVSVPAQLNGTVYTIFQECRDFFSLGFVGVFNCAGIEIEIEDFSLFFNNDNFLPVAASHPLHSFDQRYAGTDRYRRLPRRRPYPGTGAAAHVHVNPSPGAQTDVLRINHAIIIRIYRLGPNDLMRGCPSKLIVQTQIERPLEVAEFLTVVEIKRRPSVKIIENIPTQSKARIHLGFRPDIRQVNILYAKPQARKGMESFRL